MIIPWLPHLICSVKQEVSELDLHVQLASQSSTGNMWQAYQKKAIKVLLVVYNKHLSSQCNVLPQIEHVQDKYQYIDSLI